MYLYYSTFYSQLLFFSPQSTCPMRRTPPLSNALLPMRDWRKPLPPRSTRSNGFLKRRVPPPLPHRRPPRQRSRRSRRDQLAAHQMQVRVVALSLTNAPQMTGITRSSNRNSAIVDNIYTSIAHQLIHL